jgi:hypothetical protein
LVLVWTNGKGEVGVRCEPLARGTMHQESGLVEATSVLLGFIQLILFPTGGSRIEEE